MDLFIYRQRTGVRGIGRKLARALGAGELSPADKIPKGYKPVVINYGVSKRPAWLPEIVKTKGFIANKGSAVIRCADKRKTLEALWEAGVPTLEYTLHFEDAHQWLDEGHTVFARLQAKGKKGNGIVIVRPGQPIEALPKAPLYTKAFPKTHEFRVHVAFGKVIDFVQKKRMKPDLLAHYGIHAVEEDIRNHKRGWYFSHNKLTVNRKKGAARKNIEKMCLDAAEVLGIDYCAVDILATFDDDNNLLQAIVCEVNSAPGMSSSITFNAYVEAFKEFAEA